jgi:CHAT domain-containing protein
VSPGRLRALVVGDPGDPARGHHLPGARDEALEVHRLLQQKGLEVVLMIGAPGTAEVPRAARLKDFRPASRLDVLMELATGRYDLLHYAGHGDFDPQHPDLTGWLFHDGLFTSRLLERVDVAPSLVVANACLSARTAGPAGRGEADLLPGLADEFFRRGVRNYVGTAWKVNDQGAVRFARAFYDALLPTPAADGSRARGATVGRALRDARTLLAEERAYGALWAAYQHYGDPQHLLAPALAAGAASPDLADG